MPTTYWTGATDGDWSNSANWSGSKPASADTAIFDGRATQSVDVVAAMDQSGVDLAKLHIMESYTGSIGDADYNSGSGIGPLLFECSGDVIIEGTGNYYLQCGNDAADADVARTVINCTGTVELSSQKNGDSGNIAVWEDVYVLSGTVNIKGNADNIAGTIDTDAGSVDDGTWVNNLYMMPSNGRGGGVVVTIGDQCERFKATVDRITIYMAGGTLNAYTDITLLTVSGGTANIGGTAYDMDAGDDTVTTLTMYGGTVNWKPTNTAATPDEASEDPVITTLNLYGGTFDGSGMLATKTTAPEITTCTMYDGTTLNLNNGYADFTVSTLKYFGGNIIISDGQAITTS